jgi:hypothetical protein
VNLRIIRQPEKKEKNMRKVKISLDSFEKIKDFINISYQLDYDLKLISGRYIANGKSIMGIFNLDLSGPIEVNIIDKKLGPYYYPKELESFII